jgi:hypothetical protein
MKAQSHPAARHGFCYPQRTPFSQSKYSCQK